MRYRLLVLSVLLSVAFFQPSTSHVAQATPVKDTTSHPPTAQTLTGSDFDGGTRKDVSHNGDTLAPTAATGSFTSNVTQAPQAFNYLQLHWNATIPVSASVTIEGRVSPDSQSWSKWGSLAISDDFLDPRDPAGTYWSGVIFAGDARFWQLRVTLTRSPDGKVPALHKIIVRMVDAREGKKFTPPASSIHPSATLGQPAYVSRWEWGGSEVANNSVPPDYYQANHLVVHHTADSNTLVSGESSWADRVMAEWRFHTYSTNGGRGWGDVGYNWLIDPNGVIYEGRWGSSSLTQDAVGFHDTANYGSMGVVMIGTYDTAAVPTALQNSLISLLAWKAQQRQIDPFGSSYYYGCAYSSYCAPYHPGAVVLNLAGHREVLPNHTDCPGDQGINTLPSIRQAVANLLAPTNPGNNGDNVIDDTESGFHEQYGSWHDSPSGYNGHSFYTYNAAGAAQNDAVWNWKPSNGQSGTYSIDAHVPLDSGLTTSLTGNAQYTIHSASGSTTVGRSQAGTNEWINLGQYQFDGNAGGSVELTDSTGESDLATTIFFDAIRWTYIPPAPAQPQIKMVSFQATPTTVTAGEVVRISFTVQNTGSTVLPTQDPQPGNSGDLTSGYVYDENECYLSNAGQTYPTLPKVTGDFRLAMGGMEGSSALGSDCQGDVGGHPWRWGFGTALQPGETRTVVAAIRFQNYTVYNRSIKLIANLAQENVGYMIQDVGVGTITVKPENHPPLPSQVDTQGYPLAQVYAMRVMPQSLLARTSNPLSVDEDHLIGSFRWDGTDQGWGAAGPAGQTDQFIVEQARPFYAPADGTYTFEMTSDDGGWMWVDGNQVLDDHGLHVATSVTNSIFLQAGLHSLGFKFFDYFGLAQTEYSWQPPGAGTLSSIPVLPTTQTGSNQIMIGVGQVLAVSSDDLGGMGIAQFTYWIDGGSEQIKPISGTIIPLESLPGLPDGPHSVRFNATDWVGNVTPDQTINFTVNASPPQTSLTAQLAPSGVIQLSWKSNPDVRSFTLSAVDTGNGGWRSVGLVAGNSFSYFGTPGHSYQFKVTANDGIYTADSNTTSTITIPSSAHFYRSMLPMMFH